MMFCFALLFSLPSFYHPLAHLCKVPCDAQYAYVFPWACVVVHKGRGDKGNCGWLMFKGTGRAVRDLHVENCRQDSDRP